MKAPCRCNEAASTSPRCGLAPPTRRRFTAAPRPRGYAQQARCINPRINSINAAATVPIGQREGTTQTSYGHSRLDSASGFHSDILGLGQAIVDWSSSVNEDVLQQFDVAKGGRRVITVDERASVMETLDDIGAPSQVSAGGSLANTLVGVAKLARAAGKDLRVLLGGSLGTDTLGQFFNSQMKRAGVRCLLETHHPTHSQHSHHNAQGHGDVNSNPPPLARAQEPQQRQQQQQEAETAATVVATACGGHTGTVMVLTTPDAQRSFLSFFTSESLTLSDRVRAAVRSARLVVIEGYLWEMPGAERYVCEVQDLAHAVGAQVAMTAGDPGVVSRHREEMLRVISRGVDVLFTNEDEAAALVGGASEAPEAYCSSDVDGDFDGGRKGGQGDGQRRRSRGERAAAALAELCHVVVVTAGSQGSYIGAMGELHAIPPYWLPQGPVDTCGAGDAYAAGWLYAMLTGYDLRTASEFASRVASAVIGRYGPHLTDEDAEGLVQELPEHLPVQLGGGSGGGPMQVRVQLGDVEVGAGAFSEF